MNMLFRKPSVQTEGLLYPLVRALVVDRSGVMSGPGAIFKRCSCRDAAGRPLNNKCPRLAKRGHRAWTFHASATNLPGRSERVRRARDEWLAATGAAGRHRSGPHRPVLDGGAMAAVLAVHPYHSPRIVSAGGRPSAARPHGFRFAAIRRSIRGAWMFSLRERYSPAVVPEQG